MEVQEENDFMGWYHQIIHLKDKCILPNGIRFSKIPYMRSDGFDNIKFRKDLYLYFNNNIKKE